MFSKVVFAGFLALAEARAFLNGSVHSVQSVVTEAVEYALLSDLPSAKNAARLEEIKDDLRPTYVAMPKSESGQLDLPAVRYVLHRYFVQKFGWYVKGLDPNGGAWNSSITMGVAEDKLPSYVYSLLTKQLHHSGLDLGELATFAATLTDLLDQEVPSNLLRVYKLMGFPLNRRIPGDHLDDAVIAYLVLYIEGRNSEVKTFNELVEMEKRWEVHGAGWADYVLFIDDLRRTYDHTNRFRRNPFKPQGYTFDEALAFTKEFTHKFSMVSRLECAELKGKLVELEEEGTGRVRLSDFYRDTTLPYKESAHYLRSLGVVDETSPHGPSLMIPDYVTSQTNCITDSDFYSSCCHDECEDLLDHLEREIAAPSAEASQIAMHVAALPSDTVEAPRNLSKVLLNRLDEIATIHNGQVPLHGRLFLQWMHHAYPRECSFPHEAGTHKLLSQTEFMERHRLQHVLASEEEVQLYAGMLTYGDGMTLDAKLGALPWSSSEELVSRHHRAASTGSSTIWNCLRVVGAIALFGSFATALAQHPHGAVKTQEVLKSHMV